MQVLNNHEFELTADPVKGLNLVSSGLATTAFFLKKSKSMVMRAGLVDMVAEFGGDKMLMMR